MGAVIGWRGEPARHAAAAAPRARRGAALARLPAGAPRRGARPSVDPSARCGGRIGITPRRELFPRPMLNAASGGCSRVGVRVGNDGQLTLPAHLQQVVLDFLNHLAILGSFAIQLDCNDCGQDWQSEFFWQLCRDVGWVAESGPILQSDHNLRTLPGSPGLQNFVPECPAIPSQWENETAQGAGLFYTLRQSRSPIARDCVGIRDCWRCRRSLWDFAKLCNPTSSCCIPLLCFRIAL